MFSKIYKKIISIMLILSLVFNINACSAYEDIRDQYKEIVFTAFDTMCTITIFEVEDFEKYKENEDYTIENLKKMIRSLEKVFSRTDPSSELYRLNHRTSNTLMISRTLATVMDVAKAMYSWSVEAFDISTGNLIELWDVKNRTTPPTEAEIKKALSYAKNMDYEIEFDADEDAIIGDRITFHGDINTHYDLGALAKGYVAMNIEELLTSTMGVKRALINFGGSVTVIGEKYNEVPFRIGIKRPFKEGYILTENVKNRSLITSGTYERYFEYEGKIYSHVIDNSTGYPIDNELTSVTVNCANPLMGDFLSTAILIVGNEKGKILTEVLKNNYDDYELSVITIDKDENIVRF